MLELTGETGFRVMAYRRAATTTEEVGEELAARVDAKTLTELEGIGAGLAAIITTLYRGGRVEVYEELKGKVPAGLLQMLSVPGLGVTRVKRLNAELGLTTVDELEAACRDGRVAQLSGFGAKSVERLLRGVAWYRSRKAPSSVSSSTPPAESRP